MPDAEPDRKPEDQAVTTDEPKQRSVSFNRDVHVKRIAPNRAAAAPPGDGLRRQSLVGLSRQELADEAAKVLAQASSVKCSTASSPDKFFSLPNRRRNKPEPHSVGSPTRRRSEELGVTTDLPVKPVKTSLNRSKSDVTPKKYKKNNGALLGLFKRSDKDLSYSTHEPVAPTKAVTVKRSKSDVSDLKSSTSRPVRKRTGSESEEYLNSVVGKKSQLSPIIEINQADDYFKPKNAKLVGISGTSDFERVVLEVPQTQNQEYKVNPIEKPPRTKDPKPPARPKRVKPLASQPQKHFDTLPRIKSVQHKRLIVDEIDTSKAKSSIKQAINALEISAERTPEMIHSSQKPPEKLPLTKGQTVDTMVKILNQDKYTPPPKANLITPSGTAAHNNNQPFSYTKPTSVSPDPNLYARSVSPDRPPSPINKMNMDSGRGVIYTQVVCGENGKTSAKQKSLTPERRGNHSDEDEGLGYEDSRLNRNHHDYLYNGHKDDYSYRHGDEVDVTDSPITPRFKEYKSHRFVDDDLMYENQHASNNNEYEFRGRGDGMDSRRKNSIVEHTDNKYDSKIAELSYRRELLENRFNARRKRDQTSPGVTNSRFSPEKETLVHENGNSNFCSTDALNKNVRNDDLELDDGYDAERRSNELTSGVQDNRSKSRSNASSLMFESSAKEIDRREFIDKRLAEEPPESRYFAQRPKRYFPPEPEYEPPSLDSQASAEKYSPETRKYKPRSSRGYMSSQEGLNSRYNPKYKQEKYANVRDHYASNPEITQKRPGTLQQTRQEYDPMRPETFHNSLQRQRHTSSDRHFKTHEDYLEQTSSRSLRQQDSNRRRNYEDNSGPDSSNRYDNDRDRDNKFADSGIENDYRKDSNGDIHTRGVVSSSAKGVRGARGEPRNESEDEGFASSLLIASERQHTEDNHQPSRGRYADDYRRSTLRRDEFAHRERSIDDGSFYDPRIDKFEERTTSRQLNAKPPKAVKKISGLEKVKQLFSRDSSKKSKKEKDKKKDEVEMVREEDLRRRYTEYRGSAENLDAIDPRRGRITRTSDLDLDSRIDSRTSQMRDGEDSSIMDYDYSQRRRLATPSPSPSPPRRSSRSTEKNNNVREASKKPNGSWFKSLDRLSKSKSKNSKVENDSIATTEEESIFKSKLYKPSNEKAPTKNLRFFGDTDQESNSSVSKHQSILRKRDPLSSLNRSGKSLSSSVSALDKKDSSESKYKSSSYNNLHSGLDSRQSLLANSYNKEKYGANNRDLHNISEIHSNSETESQFEEREKNYKHDVIDYKYDGNTLKSDRKPPMSPLREKRRSRSQSGSKVTKNISKSNYNGSRGDLTDDFRNLPDIHSSKNEVRGSRQELSGSRNELRTRRRRVHNGATSPNDSSTEGDSSHQSQRSIVYLHAATVGDIPTSGRISRGRSRDDLSSVNSSLKPQVKTVTRSFSVLAPWKPRFYREGYDINYSQSGQQSTLKRSEKNNTKTLPPKKDSGFSFGKSKSASTRNLSTSKYDSRSSEERTGQTKSSMSTLPRKSTKGDDSKTSSSNGTLLRKNQRSRLANGSSKENLNSYQLGTLSRSRNDLHRNQKKSMSTEILSRDSPPKGTKRSSVERERLSRSISMPKDPNKSAGWFKITKKSKKVEGGNRAY